MGIFGMVLALLVVVLGLYLNGDNPNDTPTDDGGQSQQPSPPPKEPPLNR